MTFPGLTHYKVHMNFHHWVLYSTFLMQDVHAFSSPVLQEKFAYWSDITSCKNKLAYFHTGNTWGNTLWCLMFDVWCVMLQLLDYSLLCTNTMVTIATATESTHGVPICMPKLLILYYKCDGGNWKGNTKLSCGTDTLEHRNMQECHPWSEYWRFNCATWIV